MTRQRRRTCSLCSRPISVAHFLRHLEAHRRGTVIDLASIKREWDLFVNEELA